MWCRTVKVCRSQNQTLHCSLESIFWRKYHWGFSSSFTFHCSRKKAVPAAPSAPWSAKFDNPVYVIPGSGRGDDLSRLGAHGVTPLADQKDVKKTISSVNEALWDNNLSLSNVFAKKLAKKCELADISNPLYYESHSRMCNGAIEIYPDPPPYYNLLEGAGVDEGADPDRLDFDEDTYAELMETDKK